MLAALERLRYRTRLASQLIAAGRWRELWYQAWLKMRGIDVGLVPVESLQQSPERAHLHSASGGPDLEVVLKALDIASTDSVIDVGCGKGGALITLAQFPFAKVSGIDISDALVEVARKNLSRLGIENVDVLCRDAGEFTELDEYTFVYLYNPFPCNVVQQFMSHLAENLRRQPRRLTLIYKNPKCHDVVASTMGFNKVREFHHSRLLFYVYVHEPQGPRTHARR
jgi:SAM-dependent methyltransferase